MTNAVSSNHSLCRLIQKGFKESFILRFDALVSEEDEQLYHAPDFEVFQRIETPSGEPQLFAIETHDHRKGILTSEYGISPDPVSIEMIDKLQLTNLSRR